MGDPGAKHEAEQGRAPPRPIGPWCIHSENDGLTQTPSDDNTCHFEGTPPQPTDGRHLPEASTRAEPPRHETPPTPPRAGLRLKVESSPPISPQELTSFGAHLSPSSATTKCADSHQRKKSSLDECQRRVVPWKYMRAYRWEAGRLEWDREIESGNGSSHRLGTPQISLSDASQAKKNLASHPGMHSGGSAMSFSSRRAKNSILP
ncbi:hypothetical protein ACLOJK_018987 [Asimina triloba]